LNVGLTLLGRGEFSIIVAKLAQAGGLAPLLQPFAALYVLLLATLAPLLAKESERIHALLARRVKRRVSAKAQAADVENILSSDV
jgi:CPA2 family monovalent cation:H+ antiporter-2